MAKAKAPAKGTPDNFDPFDGATLVETAQDNDFSDPEPAVDEAAPRSETYGPGERVSVAAQMNEIRERNAKLRAASGGKVRRRVITHYQDAERLHRLATGANPPIGRFGAHKNSLGQIVRGSTNHFPDVATAEELVRAEEDGLMPNPGHFATGSGGEVYDTPDPTEGEEAGS
jgi:hypothetical protein